MTDERDLPPLSADAMALIEKEKLRPGPPAAIKSRMLERVALTVAAGTAGAAAVGALAGAAAGHASTAAGTSLLLKPGLIAAFVLGAGAGASTTYVVQKSRTPAPVEQQAQAPRAKQARTPEQPVVPASQPAVEQPVAGLEPTTIKLKPRPKKITQVTVPTSAKAESLAAERSLLEMARAALARSRPADALSALKQHREKFDKGQLVEEREGLQVLALAASGDDEKARAAAASFRKRYPQSLLLPAITAAVQQPGR